MFLLGLLAFLQIIFIPGFIALNLFKLETSNKLETAVYSFSLSLLINYLLIYLLTSIGIYTSITVYCIMMMEAGLLGYIHSPFSREGLMKILASVKFPLPSNVDKKEANIITETSCLFRSNSLLNKVILLLSGIVVIWYVCLFNYNLGTVFSHWDAVVSWNRWAIDWGQNHLPVQTWQYPQLIPANWSLSYVITGNNEIQFFAKEIMPLFSIGTILLFLSMAMKRRNAVYLTGIIFYAVIMNYIYDPSFIVDGYVDIAVSFFSFLTFYLMVDLQCEQEGTINYKKIILVAVFACTAAITKQAGLYLLLIALLFLVHYLYRNRERISTRNMLKTSGALLLTVGIICLWYIIKEIQIKTGVEASEVTLVTQNIYKGKPHIMRLIDGLAGIPSRMGIIGPMISYSVALFFTLGIFNKISRLPLLGIALPYIFIWGFFFSYDVRNLTLAFPFIAYCCAGGAGFLAGKFKKDLDVSYSENMNDKKNYYFFFIVLGMTLILAGLVFLADGGIKNYLLEIISFIKKDAIQPHWLDKLKMFGNSFLISGGLLIAWPVFLKLRLKMVHVMLLAITISVILDFTLCTSANLQAHQIKGQKLIGNAELNNILYKYNSINPIKGKIFTHYQMLGHLPELGKYYRGYDDSISMLKMRVFEKISDVNYFLLQNYQLSQDANEYIAKKITNKEYFVIFKYNEYIFMRINRD